MKYTFNFTIFVITLIFVSCSNKPSENDYLGTWTRDSNPTCSFTITKEGTNFFIKDNCGRAGESVYTMKEDGSLSGLNGVINISYNKESKKILYVWSPIIEHYTKSEQKSTVSNSIETKNEPNRQVKFENNEAEGLIRSTLGLPKTYSIAIGVWNTTELLDALSNEGLITYNVHLNGSNDPTIDLNPKGIGQSHYLGQNADNEYIFKTYDIDIDQITGISIDEETQIATVRFSLKAINITPFGQVLSRFTRDQRFKRGNPYSLKTPLNGELIFKKFDKGWQLKSNQNMSSDDMLELIKRSR